MSQSSSASGSNKQGGAGAGYYELGSPVSYCIGPVAYEPEVLCLCNLKACKWISWSNEQPGRKYYRCRKAGTAQDCLFNRWVEDDEELSPWYKELLRDLRDAVWHLKEEVAKKDAEVDAKDLQLVGKQMEIEEKKKEVEDKQREVNAKQQQLQAKDDAVQALEGKVKNKNQCIDALVVICVVLLIILMMVLNGKTA